MFGSDTEQELERRRSRMLLILGGLGALVLAIAIVMLSGSAKLSSSGQSPTPTPTPGGMQARLEGALREGNPDFNGYKPQVTLEDIETYAAPNALGMTRFTVNVKVTNRGSRSISGLELTALALALDGKAVLAKNTNIPIPNMRKNPLKPGEGIRVSMIVDTPASITEGDISNFVPSVTGLILQ